MGEPAAPLLIPGVERELARRALGMTRTPLRLVPGKQGGSAGGTGTGSGAAALALEHAAGTRVFT